MIPQVYESITLRESLEPQAKGPGDAYIPCAFESNC